MSLFTYEATDSSGRFIRGSMETKDEASLVEKLQEMGYFPIEISRPSGKKAFVPFIFKPFGRRVSGRDVLKFTQELSDMLEAGITLDKSLSILAELEVNEAFRPVILDIQKIIHGGGTLSDGIEKHTGVFPEVYVSMVKAGEAGGALESVLARIKKFMEETESIKDEITSALIYPLLITAVGALSMMVMLFFVIPKFAGIFAGAGAAMPLPTKVLLGVSEMAIRFWWTFPAASIAGYFVVRRHLNNENGRLSFDTLKLKLPLLGPIFKKTAISRFSRTLGTLLQSGVPILNALNIAVKTIGNRRIAGELIPVINGVKNGRGISMPLKEAASFPHYAVHILTVGEETGRLDEMLIRLSDAYDRETGIALKRLLQLLEPAIILVMAVIVGFIVISLLLAVFSLNDLPM